MGSVEANDKSLRTVMGRAGLAGLNKIMAFLCNDVYDPLAYLYVRCEAIALCD